MKARNHMEKCAIKKQLIVVFFLAGPVLIVQSTDKVKALLLSNAIKNNEMKRNLSNTHTANSRIDCRIIQK